MPRSPFQISNSPSELAALGLTKDGLRLPPSQLTALHALGWNLIRIQRSLTLLRARVKNETLSPEICDFLRPLLNKEVPEAAREISIEIRWTQETLRVGYSALPAGFALPLALFWLPALRTFWERTLRRSHCRRLTHLLPRTWFLTADASPPGTVIPGLQITSWNLIDSTHGSFWWTHGDTAELLTATEVRERMQKSSVESPILLIEEPSVSPGSLCIRASYQSRDTRLLLDRVAIFPSSKDVEST